MNMQPVTIDSQHPEPEVLEEMEVHLQTRMGNLVSGLRIIFAEGGLILQGRSHSYYAKQLAQHALMNATDLPIAANDIEVC